MENNDSDNPSRRAFLQASAALLGGAAVTACGDRLTQFPEPSEQQRALKRKSRSRVLVADVADYDAVNKSLLDAWKEVGPDVKGKSVFLKVNLVGCRGDAPIFTNAAVVEAAIRALNAAGAKEVKIGDGPALTRDTEEMAKFSGIEAVCKSESVEFVDLNIDDLDKVVNPLNFTGVSEFLMPRSVMRADVLISVPKMKTHHWALMTCAMKNMFGVVPGRKYGWPKNILHIKGIDWSIVDIVSTVKPSFAIVDGIIAMEGDGPINGTAKKMQALVLGDDLVAVDTVCGLSMELPVQNIPYLKLGGMVLGNNDLSQIDVVGTSIDAIKKKFLLPPTYESNGKLKKMSSAEDAASGMT